MPTAAQQAQGDQDRINQAMATRQKRIAAQNKAHKAKTAADATTAQHAKSGQDSFKAGQAAQAMKTQFDQGKDIGMEPAPKEKEKKYDKKARTAKAYDQALEIIRSKGYNPSDKSTGDTSKVIRYINNILKAHEIKGFKNYGQMLKMLKAGVPAKKDRPSKMHTGKNPPHGQQGHKHKDASSWVDGQKKK